MNTYRLVAVVALSSLSLLGCGKKEGQGTAGAREQSSTTTPADTKIDLATAQTMFNERCAACHGTDGKGNGPAAAALNPKPRNYTDAAWQTSVSDAQIRKTITLGGAAVGKSPMMPASPDLDEKPEVVEGLLKIVRKFGS